jgi:hypothetical protein
MGTEREVPRETLFKTEAQAEISLLRDEARAKKLMLTAAQKEHAKAKAKLDRAISSARKPRP